MKTSPLEVWLWLLLVMQPNNPKTAQILSQYGGDATRASIAIRDENLSILSANEKKRAVETRNGAIMRLLKICEENEIRIVTLDSEEYPPLLRKIENPPIVLFVKGSLAGLNNELVLSAVGTKTPSEYSVSATDRLVGTLARAGAVFVSGVAKGLDSAVHEACIKAKRRSVAILPCGILEDYPKGSGGFRRGIIENGGAVVSEFLPYTKASLGNFYTRNRIISGMSLGTIVLQAGPKSGALVTAKLAFSQERAVFYIPPHDIFNESYGGAAVLAAQGAHAVFEYSDITARLLKNDSSSVAVSQKIHELALQNQQQPKVISADNDNKTNSAPKSEPKAEKTAKKAEIPDNLSPEEKTLAEIIAQAPSDIDALIDKSGLDYETAIGALTILELSGIIARRMDGNYEIADESESL